MTDEMNEILKECAELGAQPIWRMLHRFGIFCLYLRYPEYLKQVNQNVHTFNPELIRKYSMSVTKDFKPIDYARLYKGYLQEDIKELREYYADSGNN